MAGHQGVVASHAAGKLRVTVSLFGRKVTVDVPPRDFEEAKEHG